MFAAVGAVSAQTDATDSGISTNSSSGKNPARFRSKYFNIGYAGQKLIQSYEGLEGDLAKSGFGLGLTTGKSFVLHKKPLVGMIRICLDATWFDMNYAYQEGVGINEGAYLHQYDISMGVGPSVHVNPIGKLSVNAYFHYNPTFASIFTLEDFDSFAMSGGYSNVFVTGGAVSWGVISVGAEARWGKGTYNNLFGGDDEESPYYDEGNIFNNKIKLKTKGYRVYLSFRW